MKLPHWLALAAALAIVIVSWVMNQAAKGTLVLPAALLTGLTIAKTVLQLFTNVPGSSSGGTTSSAPNPTSLGAGGQPPLSTRMAYRLSARPVDTRLRLPRWVYGLRAVALCACILFFGGKCVLACQGNVPSPQTVQDVTIGLNAAICVLTTYATDVQKGESEGIAVADAAFKCGVSAVQATGVLDSHKKAETLEKAGKLPQSKNVKDQADHALWVMRFDPVPAS